MTLARGGEERQSMRMVVLDTLSQDASLPSPLSIKRGENVHLQLQDREGCMLDV